MIHAKYSDDKGELLMAPLRSDITEIEVIALRRAINQLRSWVHIPLFYPFLLFW